LYCDGSAHFSNPITPSEISDALIIINMADDIVYIISLFEFIPILFECETTAKHKTNIKIMQ